MHDTMGQCEYRWLLARMLFHVDMRLVHGAAAAALCLTPGFVSCASMYGRMGLVGQACCCVSGCSRGSAE